MKEYTDMTHEELATHARDVARRMGDHHLLDLAKSLQELVDKEMPSTEHAAAVTERLKLIEPR